MSFTRAILRLPGPNFASGLTTANQGPPDYARMLGQSTVSGQSPSSR